MRILFTDKLFFNQIYISMMKIFVDIVDVTLVYMYNVISKHFFVYVGK